MTQLVKLDFLNKLKSNLENGSGLIQVILGPRQVGKTTSVLDFITRNYPNNHHYVSADQTVSNSQHWLETHWQEALRDRRLLVIDEIQKCDNWSESVKKLYDRAKREKQLFPVVLLGSSSLQIQSCDSG